ncbi:hypothetical protein POM88_048765 [Heracleum sosnowskyi]|uniref:Replication protein A OB domain-containing protein n=1 Tax=Heracleum sosnowskyi TaxID=360622 RepID=A0AAD8GVX6_9APIA|nr:hypothetical protein POM88_048765 [Heracleum sosnowskyi]
MESRQIPMFTKNLKVGEVYIISTYNVANAYPMYRPVPGELVIKFHDTTKSTKLYDISISAIPMFKFQMTDFEKARTKAGETINLMDVVGKLTEVTEMQATKNGKKKIDIILANERDDKMRITLWENQAHAFLQCNVEYNKTNVFVVVTGTSAKDLQGDIVLWSSYSTQYFFNIDHPDIVELKKNYNIEEDLIHAIVPFIKTKQQAMAQNIERVKIAQLFEATVPDGEKMS